MRVLYFHQHYSTPEGGSGIRSYEFARYLIQQGHEVTIVCGSYDGSHTGLSGAFQKGKRQGVFQGINVIEFELPYSNNDGFIKRTFTFMKFAVRSIRIALQYDYDVLFATTTPLTAGIPGIAAKIFRRKPFVFEVRDLWPELPKAMGVIKNKAILTLMDWLESLSYRCADACIGLSPGIVEGIQRKTKQSKPVIMIPNGCDITLFDEQTCPFTLPEAIKPGDFVALFAGAHGIANGLDAVLDVAVELKRMKRENIKILLIGKGKLKASLQQQAKQENLTNCVFMDSIPKKAIPDLFAQVHIGLMILANVPAFYYGTSPNKFFDYIAAGLPVINNYPGWLADMITEKNCGIVVPPQDVKAFADALLQLSENPELLKEMSNNAKQLANLRFNRTVLAGEFVQFLEKVQDKG